MCYKIEVFNRRVIYNTYIVCTTLTKKAKKKLSSKFSIDFKIFRNTKLTTFEALVKFLKENKKLSYREIGLILGRDERNIWTVYNRGKKKIEKK